MLASTRYSKFDGAAAQAGPAPALWPDAALSNPAKANGNAASDQRPIIDAAYKRPVTTRTSNTISTNPKPPLG